jgi:hypothetical protein
LRASAIRLNGTLAPARGDAVDNRLIDRRPPAEPYTLGPLERQGVLRALRDKTALELSEHGEDAHDGLIAGENLFYALAAVVIALLAVAYMILVLLSLGRSKQGTRWYDRERRGF